MFPIEEDGPGPGPGPGPAMPPDASDSEEDCPEAPLGHGLTKWSYLIGPPPNGGADPQAALTGWGGSSLGDTKSARHHIALNILELFNSTPYHPSRCARLLRIRAEQWDKDQAYAACAVHFQQLCARHLVAVPDGARVKFKRVGSVALDYHLEMLGLLWPLNRSRPQVMQKYVSAEMPGSEQSFKRARLEKKRKPAYKHVPLVQTVGLSPWHPDYGQAQRELVDWKKKLAPLFGAAIARTPQVAAFVVNFKDVHYLPGLAYAKGLGDKLQPYRSCMPIMVCLSEAVVYLPHRGLIPFGTRARCEQELPWLLAYLGMASFASKLTVRALLLQGPDGEVVNAAPAAPAVRPAGQSPASALPASPAIPAALEGGLSPGGASFLGSPAQAGHRGGKRSRDEDDGDDGDDM